MGGGEGELPVEQFACFLRGCSARFLRIVVGGAGLSIAV